MFYLIGMRIAKAKPIFLFLLSFSAVYCSAQVDYQQLATYSENGFVNVVVEIPAGTNHKIEFDKTNNEFLVDQKEGKDRIIDFLPYPGNYGFIPSTYMNPEIGGDGDALDILVLGESVPISTIIEVVPIAVVMLIDGGEIDSKIIAVPANKSSQIMNINNFNDLKNNYAEVQKIIELWFLNYKGKGIMKLKGWEDEKAAVNEIEKWLN